MSVNLEYWKNGIQFLQLVGNLMLMQNINSWKGNKVLKKIKINDSIFTYF